MTGGYFPLWRKIFDSSINEEDVHVRWIWAYMLSEANADGILTSTVGAISRGSNIPLELTEEALEVLMTPDPASTSKKEEGRRVISGGQNTWVLVNYQEYREMARKEHERALTRARVARHRSKNVTDEALQSVTDVTECNGDVTISNESPLGLGSGSVLGSSKKERKGEIKFEEVWGRYPRKVSKARSEKAWRNLTVKDQQAALAELPRHIASWAGKDPQYIPHFVTWINQRRWEDQIETHRPPSHAGAHQEGNGEWLADTVRKADRDKYGNHSMWERYEDEACDFPPKSAPPFMDWLETLEGA